MFADERVAGGDARSVQTTVAVHGNLDFPVVSENQSAEMTPLPSLGPAPRLRGCPTLQNPCAPDMVCSLSAGDCKGGFGTSCCSYIDDNGNGICHSC